MSPDSVCFFASSDVASVGVRPALAAAHLFADQRYQDRRRRDCSCETTRASQCSWAARRPRFPACMQVVCVRPPPENVFLACVSVVLARHPVTEPNQPGIRKARQRHFAISGGSALRLPAAQRVDGSDLCTQLSDASQLQRTLATKESIFVFGRYKYGGHRDGICDVGGGGWQSVPGIGILFGGRAIR